MHGVQSSSKARVFLCANVQSRHGVQHSQPPTYENPLRSLPHYGSLDVAEAVGASLPDNGESATNSSRLRQAADYCSHTAVAQASALSDISVMMYAILVGSKGNEEGCSLKMRKHWEINAWQVPESPALRSGGGKRTSQDTGIGWEIIGVTRCPVGNPRNCSRKVSDAWSWHSDRRNSAYSFTGCVKNLQLNGQWMSSMFQTFGVTPCFEGLSEPGTYFSEEGGYVVLDDTFNLGLKFELVVEVRPRVASGVLLHVYTAAGEYLTMYIHQGAVIVLVNNGVREFFTQVTPRLGLCDGSWHRITLIRDANVVQLDVDSEVNHVVGPLNPSTKSARTPVFIGGAPESLLPEGIATRRDYTGCMRKLTVNESQVSFSKAALVSGAVSVGSCPAA
ncbi:laminin subunit alpha-4-like [Oncorhynchus mykiss]|uniref:laminin subunit alpha-4-like n=1 Tax=Oncorhynchus mykiss TaxID=8022 RepID=UPI001878AB9E|nr:laminin subunit alpha-4-like [Oncorhynchus mykiss]